MRVRPALDSDLALLLGMMEDFNRLEGIAFRRQQTMPALHQLIADPALGRVELLEVEGSVIGYAILTWGYDLEFDGRDAFLTEIYIRPEARGRGLGKALLATMERLARESGAHALHLGVRPDNATALALYRGAAFEPWTRLLLTKLL